MYELVPCPTVVGRSEIFDRAPSTPGRRRIRRRGASRGRGQAARRACEACKSTAKGIASVVPDAIINGPVVGDPGTRLPGNVHASFPGAEGDALLMLLDAAGVDCSTGSACTAGVPEPSHVLLAMGVDERTARSSLRFSFGRTSTDDDVSAIIRALPGAVERARRAGSVSSDRYRAARENEVDR